MTLGAGARLGPYEILAAVGAGGMGEVYKARDTRLGRTVAIKVLPERVAADPERRRRFEHEARAASALNHPHICTLYDVGSTRPTRPGPAGAAPTGSGPAVDYLLMEYLEGETLARRLAKGRLRVEDVLTLGVQVAGALAVVFTVVERFFSWETAYVALHRFGTKGWDVVARGAADARYLPTGHLIYFRRGKMFGVGFDLERLASFGADLIVPASWTPGRRLLFIRYSPARLHDVWALSQGGKTWSGGELRPLATRATESFAQVSPDGRRLAYASNESGRAQVSVIRFPELADKRPVSGDDGGSSPVWARDGRELFYVRGAGDNAELVAHNVGPDGAPVPPARTLFALGPLRLQGHQPAPGFDVARDGRFLFPQNPDTQPPLTNRIHIIENWFEELKAKVPGR